MFWKKKASKDKKSREDVIRQAQEIASAKRTEIGDETLNQIRQAIHKRETSTLEQARKKILAADQDRVKDYLSYMIQKDSDL